MARYTRNERIAILVIEDQIWNYRNSITNKLMTVHPEMFKDIDSDDVDGNNKRAAEIFKDITDTDIYTALGEAYGYDRTTIISKLGKHKKRIDIWIKFFTHPDTFYFENGCATYLNKPLTDISYVLQLVENDHKSEVWSILMKGIVNKQIDNEILSEYDIWAIKKLVADRSDAIYDRNPDSKVAPALTKFERYMIDYEKPTEEPKKTDIPKEDPRITDGTAIKNALKNVVETYTAMGCNSIQFEVSLDDGSTWVIESSSV